MGRAMHVEQKGESHTTLSSRQPAIQEETQKRGHCKLLQAERRGVTPCLEQAGDVHGKALTCQSEVLCVEAPEVSGGDRVLWGLEEALNSGGWRGVAREGFLGRRQVGHVLKDGWDPPGGEGVGEVGRRAQQVTAPGPEAGGQRAETWDQTRDWRATTGQLGFARAPRPVCHQHGKMLGQEGQMRGRRDRSPARRRQG